MFIDRLVTAAWATSMTSKRNYFIVGGKPGFETAQGHEHLQMWDNGKVIAQLLH